jgi:hypothetical protein
MGKRRFAAAFFAAVALLLPTSALAFGPAPPPGNPDGTAQLDACGAAFDRQADKGITAGGGPKAGELGPLNCDHFFQDEESPAANHIGNGWPPPPFQE